ncbi:MAG: hypothetical protein IT331_13550 [Anaerolineae bacterium]|nr:hypothetical protein [Anaerolineae bacterium]
MSQIILRPELVARVRLQVLYDVVRELVEAFSVDSPEQTASLIRKGVLEKPYFSAIHIYFLNGTGKRVGEATLQIDWNLHKVKIKSGETTYYVDPSPNKSIHEQISEIFPVLVRHVNKMKRVLGVKRTEVWYSWRREISDDEKRYQEARIELGFSAQNTRRPPDWAEARTDPLKDDDDDDDNDDIYLEYVAQSLQELRVVIKHNLRR